MTHCTVILTLCLGLLPLALYIGSWFVQLIIYVIDRKENILKCNYLIKIGMLSLGWEEEDYSTFYYKNGKMSEGPVLFFTSTLILVLIIPVCTIMYYNIIEVFICAIIIGSVFGIRYIRDLQKKLNFHINNKDIHDL